MAKSEQKSAPAGTGSLPGLGESFSVNLSTGQGTFTYQMPLPSGVAGHTPKLVLEYVHGYGPGAFGLGWRLPLRSISRALDFGTPDEGLVERFLDTGAEIMPVADGTFRAVRETAFARYSLTGQGWKIEERNGVVHELGTGGGARASDPAGRTVEWLLERSTDASGNTITYTYLFDGGFAYPAGIRYAAYEVRFVYEDRPDARQDGRAGFLRRRAKRCTQVRLVLDPGASERLIRTWDFAYDLASGSGVSLLASVQLTSRGPAPDGSLDVRRPAARFRYSFFDPRGFAVKWMRHEDWPPPPLTDPDVALVTLDDAPLPGILVNRNGREYYWANRGDGNWGAPRPLAQAPLASSFARDGLAFVDMDGSGTADLMTAGGLAPPGYYKNDGSAGWQRFIGFPRGRPSPQWSDPGLRMLDADGDGLVDALTGGRRGLVWWRNQGSEGWSAPELVPRSAEGLAEVDLAGRDVHLADMTGDGLPDLVRIRSGSVEYWPNLGRGRFGPRVLMLDVPRLPGDSSGLAPLLVDLDGDGCADLVQFSGEGLTFYQNQNGQRFAGPVAVEIVPAPLAGTVRAANMRGGSTAGLVWNSRTSAGPGYVEFSYDCEEPPYLLTEVDNGCGLISEIRYRSAVEDYLLDRNAGQRWTTNFPFPYLVVGGTRETDRVSGRVTAVDFRYHEAHFERDTRQFQGFRSTERIERGDASRPDTRQVHHFLMAQERTPGQGREYAALNGLMSGIETYQLDGSPLEGRPYRIESCEHGLTLLDEAPDGRRRAFVFVTVHREEDSERSDDVRIEEKQYTYDDSGNVIREVRRGWGTQGGAPQPARTLTTEIAYAASATHYLLEKPARVALRDGDGNLLSEKRLYYDGPPFVGLPSGQADRGLVTREEEWVLPQTEFDAHYAGMNQAVLGYVPAPNADGVPSVFASTARSRYDSRGLLVAARDPLGNETRYAYDAAGLFRTRLTDLHGDTSFAFDRATGQITQVTYADGSVTRFAYDAQGRVLGSALPGQDLANPPTIYSYDETQVPNRRTVQMRPADGATVQATTYYDGHGKEFQQRVEVEPGRFLVSALKLPNPWGDLAQEFEPTFAPDAEFALPDTAGRPSRQFFYDARGRVVRTVNFNGGVSTAAYRPFSVVTRDANDNDDSEANAARGQNDTPHEEVFDALRYLTAVTEHLSETSALTTAYDIGPQGELLVVRDAQGVKSGYRYDRRGCRLEIATREAGTRKIWYDARRKPVRTLDGAAHDIAATWDAAGRLLGLTSGGVALETYTYDTIAQHALGRLAQVTYAGGRQVFTYDPAGRLMQRGYYYDGHPAPQALGYEYDGLGRQTAVIHTDGTRIERQLTANGWLKAIPGVLPGIEYDPRGLPIELRFANGVRTAYEYTPGPGRVLRQTTTGPSGDALEDVAYTFDQMEIMLSSNDTVPGASGLREYGYDPLYQLARMSSSENGQQVARQYEYAGGYNLARLDEARTTLHFDDALHPDRPNGLTVGGAARFDLGYDGNGNTLSLPGRQFSYNAKNELSRFTTEDGLVAEYRYDHLGMRVSKRVDDGHGHVAETLFVGDQAEIRDGAPAYFVKVGPIRVAAVAAGTTHFIHENTTGSTAFITDAAGQRAGQVDFLPFGNRGSSSGQLDFLTFSLHPVDPESGLVYMRRRYYCPSLGRFLTPDLMAIYQPETFLHAPASLHLYAFVANDPLNKTDSTGMSFWSFLGAVVGVIVGIVVAIGIIAAVVATGGALGVLVGIGLALAASLTVTGVSYIVASNVDPNSAFGDFMRGFMIGFNAGMNATLASAIFGSAVIGIALGVVNFLATFDGIAQNSTYQGILGWTSWLMPMSWGATGLGLVFYMINLIVAGVTGNQWDAAKIDKLAVDWNTGSIVIVGGLIRNPTAFDMGNFVLMNPNYVDGSSADRTYDAVLRHETGHTLAIAAFGSAFGILDLIGENVVGSGANDYGEEIAESHANRASRPTIPMWG